LKYPTAHGEHNVTSLLEIVPPLSDKKWKCPFCALLILRRVVEAVVIEKVSCSLKSSVGVVLSIE
jgi:hypothetical protein